jgi:hypothetical protein
MTPSLLEDMIDAFSDARQNWTPILRNTAVALLLWIIWKTQNLLIFDAVRVTDSEFFTLMQRHLMLWVVRAPRGVGCDPLFSWCASLAP